LTTNLAKYTIALFRCFSIVGKYYRDSNGQLILLSVF